MVNVKDLIPISPSSDENFKVKLKELQNFIDTFPSDTIGIILDDEKFYEKLKRKHNLSDYNDDKIVKIDTDSNKFANDLIEALKGSNQNIHYTPPKKEGNKHKNLLLYVK